MSEPPLKPVLQRPPGYKDPNAPPAQGYRPPPRKPVLPSSFHPKRKRRSCCRVCCCCFCITLLILILILLVCGAVFYLWFEPKPPVFHLQSFKISRFNVTAKTDGTYLDAQSLTRVEVKNSNDKIKYYFGATEVDVTVGSGKEETNLGSTKLPKFTLGKKNTTSLKVETKVSSELVGDGLGSKLRAGFRSKELPLKVEARTKVGVGLLGLKLGMVGVTAKCGGVMKQLDGGSMPKCDIVILKWLRIQ